MPALHTHLPLLLLLLSASGRKDGLDVPDDIDAIEQLVEGAKASDQAFGDVELDVQDIAYALEDDEAAGSCNPIFETCYRMSLPSLSWQASSASKLLYDADLLELQQQQEQQYEEEAVPHIQSPRMPVKNTQSQLPARVVSPVSKNKTPTHTVYGPAKKAASATSHVNHQHVPAPATKAAKPINEVVIWGSATSAATAAPMKPRAPIPAAAVPAMATAAPPTTKNVAFYAINLGEYELVHPVFPRATGTRMFYVCDRDRIALQAAAMGYTPLKLTSLPVPGDYVRSQRVIKARPHHFLPADVQVSIYMDACFVPVSADSLEVQSTVARLLAGGNTLAVVDHPVRRCIFSEAQEVRRLRLDDPNKITAMETKLLMENYPSNKGLSETGILVREHTPALNAAMDEWAAIIQSHSRRDQLSFDYVMWKHRLKYNRQLTRAQMYTNFKVKNGGHNGPNKHRRNNGGGGR